MCDGDTGCKYCAEIERLRAENDALSSSCNAYDEENVRLREALKAIRRHIDSPAHYDKGIDDLCEAGLGDTP
jgi:predicted RNase H-like nuclease (RuvC/YqgF family)